MSRTPDLTEDEKLTVAVHADHQAGLHRPRPNDFITSHSASELTPLPDVNTDPKNRNAEIGIFSAIRTNFTRPSSIHDRRFS